MWGQSNRVYIYVRTAFGQACEVARRDSNCYQLSYHRNHELVASVSLAQLRTSNTPSPDSRIGGMAEIALTPAEEQGLADIEAAFTSGNFTTSAPATGDVQLDSKGLLLKQGAEDGISLRSPLGQKFGVAANGGKSDAYKAMSREDKAMFRKAWCKEALEEHVQVLKEKTMTKSRSKTSTMTMVSGRALILREGLPAFTKYAAKCARLGAPWIEWDSMWERFVYADITKEYRDRFEQAWKVTLSEGDAPPESNTLPSGAGAALPANAGAALPARAGVAPPGDTLAVGGGPSNKRRRLNEKSNLATPLKETSTAKGDKAAALAASKLRAKIHAVQGTARQLQENIKTTPAEWDWANVSKLKQASTSLSEFLQSSSFVSSYVLLGPTAEFKNGYKNDPVTMRNEFNTFVSKGDPVATELSKETARLLAMHAANKKATA